MASRFYSFSKAVMPPAEVSKIIDGLAACKYVGRSPLGQEFVRTLGFSIVFQREALDDVVEHFPFLDCFLDTVMFSDSNAFYVNPLILQGSSHVKAHIDCRLLPGDIRIIPNLVSVFYAEVDKAMQGGRLILNVGGDDQVSLTPEANSLVHFLGSTVHCVSRVRNPRRRISVVCEQYNLDEQTLQGFPYFKVITDIDSAPRVNALASAS
ncbi:hypothetical protein ACQKPE_19500 [Pseudomonas sp. NPDC089554]|uniref:hypothetical protein n=1 Tax=Pseudomonas sp. NPDC089554 TaxID=3390653 RepID=UPI003CFD02BE